MKLSAIVPVYNNASTLAGVLSTLLSHPAITEVIAVDDGSTDGSDEVISGFKKVRFIRHGKNMGKGAGIVSGWHGVSLDDIMNVDADLSNFSTRHIDDMVRVYGSNTCDMVIAARNTVFPFGWVSGERIYKKSVVMPYVSEALTCGNGIEQVINYAYRNLRVEVIIARDVGHILKYERHPVHEAAYHYAKEGWQLLRTEHRLGYPVLRNLPHVLKKKVVV